MTTQANRNFELLIGTKRFATNNLDGQPQQILGISFKIEKDLKKEPNKATIDLINLSGASRKNQIQKGDPVVLKGGYVANMQQIFQGDVTFAASSKPGTQWITTVQAGDGAKALRTGRINEAFKGGVKPSSVFNKLKDALGLDEGNLSDVINDPSILKDLVGWVQGKVVSGNAGEILEQLSKNLGYDVSVQDGALSFLKRGTKQTLPDPTIKISRRTGLLESPEVGENGEIRLRALLNGGLRPGRKINVDSIALSGATDYRTTKTTYTGNTWGNDWFVDLEAEPL